MNPIEAEIAAIDARIDQARAKASERLDKFIEVWKRAAAQRDGNDDDAFRASVMGTIHYVDPKDQLPDGQSNDLTFVAEVLAVAIGRLAKAAQ